ncbi:putative porin [Pelagicoccus enzymogenes]|uniref:putative porin n=1 Tax=Pelagicoccus enzymogenes TaxID=2773457 RepID=UPI00280C599A|nr:putative porin [Pelagicoccus enzymogenes]MDQ8198123.1 putative porin [Pelagicoccus enzymogenes]
MNLRKLSYSVLLTGVIAGSLVSTAQAQEFIPMPSKLDSLKLYGDARFRFQAEEINSGDTRSRFRYRVRAGADASFKDTGFKMGIRLETAEASDSTNATLGGFFDKAGDELFVGKAYLSYEGDDFEILLGKHSHPFTIDSAFWDSDIAPEGISESFSVGDMSYNFGQYIISDERENRSGSESDAFMFVAQAVWANDNITVAPTFLTTSGDRASARQEQGGFNNENGVDFFDDFMVVQVPFTVKVEGGKIYGTIGMNLEADTMNPATPYYGGSAWDGGDEDLFFNFGYKYGSAKKPGTWEASLEYRHIEGAAYTPNLSDSDFAKNSNNHAGFVLKYKYAVTEFFSIGGAYMDSSAIEDAFNADVVSSSDVKLLQVDAAIKF